MAKWQRVLLHPLTCLLLGFALRMILFNRFPLREDEAIYGYWALHFLHEDPWFLHVWPDKPPIFLWSLSAAFSLFGATPAAGRFLNIAISSLTIPVVGITAQYLWGKCAGQFAAWAMVLNPFAISFAPTLFTDPLLVFAGMFAFYWALNRRHFWAGFWLAVAIMTKQQGVLYVPLVAGALLLDRKRRRQDEEGKGRGGERGRSLSYFILGLLAILLPILLWDSQRWAVAPSPWDWSMRNYAPLRIVPVSEWAASARHWSELLWYLAASWLVWSVLLAAIGFALARSRSQRTPEFFSPLPLITIWSLAFVALHITTTLQIWDRYLLPLAPMMALSIGWASGNWRTHKDDKQGSLVAILLLLTMLLPAWTAANGQLPIGGDHGAYSGFDEMVAKMKIATKVESEAGLEKLPSTRFILYHRTLGWHYQFYLYDAVRSGAIELRWYPDSVYLADNATKAPHLRKFLILPTWSAMPELDFYLRSRGLQREQIGRAGNFVLYELVETPRSFCHWCFSTVHRHFPTLTDFAAPAMICKS